MRGFDISGTAGYRGSIPRSVMCLVEPGSVRHPNRHSATIYPRSPSRTCYEMGYNTSDNQMLLLVLTTRAS